MQQGNFNDTAYKRLVQLIEKNGKNSKDFDAKNPPYVVFDFDNTTAINDVEEALLVYQIENLRFKFSPSEITNILKTGIPDVTKFFTKEFNNTDGKPLNVDIISKDITEAYTFLYSNYKGFNNGGKQTLTEIKKTPQYKAFASKVNYLYEAINGTFDASVGYPWVTYLFTGMTPNQVKALAIESNDFWLKYPNFTKLTWTTPQEYKGEGGVVSTSYKTKIDFPAEMQNLYTAFKENGIKVYVCSASFIDVIKAAASTKKYGYTIPEEQVFAMRLQQDADGKYINKFDTNYFQTQQKGKTKTINKFIRPKHQNQDPIFVAGDSKGDYAMLTSYPNMQLGLILDRNKKDMLELAEKDNRFVVQARNENTGKFIKDKKSILLKK